MCMMGLTFLNQDCSEVVHHATALLCSGTIASVQDCSGLFLNVIECSRTLKSVLEHLGTCIYSIILGFITITSVV